MFFLTKHYSKPISSAHKAYCEGQKVMGWTSHVLGILSPGAPKNNRFGGFFGVSAEVAVKVWGMMKEHNFAITCGHLPLCERTPPTI